MAVMRVMTDLAGRCQQPLAQRRCLVGRASRLFGPCDGWVQIGRYDSAGEAQPRLMGVHPLASTGAELGDRLRRQLVSQMMSQTTGQTGAPSAGQPAGQSARQSRAHGQGQAHRQALSAARPGDIAWPAYETLAGAPQGILVQQEQEQQGQQAQQGPPAQQTLRPALGQVLEQQRLPGAGGDLGWRLTLTGWCLLDGKFDGELAGGVVGVSLRDSRFEARRLKLFLFEWRHLIRRRRFRLPEFGLENEMNAASFQQWMTLPPRLAMVFDMIMAGKHPKDMATAMNLSIYTVREYIHKIHHKFGVDSRESLMALFLHQNDFI